MLTSNGLSRSRSRFPILDREPLPRTWPRDGVDVDRARAPSHRSRARDSGRSRTSGGPGVVIRNVLRSSVRSRRRVGRPVSVRRICCGSRRVRGWAAQPGKRKPSASARAVPCRGRCPIVLQLTDRTCRRTANKSLGFPCSPYGRRQMLLARPPTTTTGRDPSPRASPFHQPSSNPSPGQARIRRRTIFTVAARQLIPPPGVVLSSKPSVSTTTVRGIRTAPPNQTDIARRLRFEWRPGRPTCPVFPASDAWETRKADAAGRRGCPSADAPWASFSPDDGGCKG